VSANQWRRDLYFDTQSALPTLLEVVDSNGERLEFYSFENLEMNIPKLNNPDAFNPARVLP
jgi:negative regulator of sigma E activity